MSTRAQWLSELRAITALSWPLALTNLAQLAMGTTDVLMMARLGPETLAAGALGVNLYLFAMIFGIGALNAATPLIAAALGRGARATERVAATVRVSFWSALIVTAPAWCALWFAEAILRAIGQDAALSAAAGVYVRALQWALLPFLCFLALRSLISALERPRWAALIGFAAIGVNALGNWCLMLGHCGVPPMGIAGSGLATSLTSALMFGALALVCMRDPLFRLYRIFAGPWRPDAAGLRAFWRLALPLAATMSFEMTIFIAAVFLMGLIGPAPLAAHAIAIQIASLTFMVPLGVAQAASVRVGLAYGARDAAAVGRAGWTAFAVATAFMAAMSLVMIGAPRVLIGAFIDVDAPGNAEIARLAGVFLAFAALFQTADGAQAVGAGMLRGLHDTRVPMVFALIGYWGVGLPLGAALAFGAGWGGAGIWTGLACGLGIVAALMMTRWARRARLGLMRP